MCAERSREDLGRDLGREYRPASNWGERLHYCTLHCAHGNGRRTGNLCLVLRSMFVGEASEGVEEGKGKKS